MLHHSKVLIHNSGSSPKTEDEYVLDQPNRNVKVGKDIIAIELNFPFENIDYFSFPNLMLNSLMVQNAEMHPKTNKYYKKFVANSSISRIINFYIIQYFYEHDL